jgi:dTDP-4-amino-4,6-dideoxygalactose transaminase
MKSIPYSKQWILKQDINNVTNVLKSPFLTKGSETINFEKNIRLVTKARYCLSTINASSSLLLLCKALNISKNDIVWTTAVTYVASINCALHCGAQIDLVDIDPATNNISTSDLEKKLKIAKIKKKLPSLIILVHLGGLPCDLINIHKLSKKYNFKIIEDASHALGSNYYKNPIGNCKYSDATVFSFHPVKTITSAEGGAITTNSEKLYKKLVLLRENGQLKKFSKSDPNFYDIVDLGYNFRINEINSKLGQSQIKNLKFFIKKKKNITNFYYKNFNKYKKYISFQPLNKNVINSFHLFIIKINFFFLKINKNNFILNLRKKNVFVNTHYIPLYKFSFLKKFLNIKKLKNSEDYYNTAISIPIYPSMSKKEMIYVVKSIIGLIKNNVKKSF